MSELRWNPLLGEWTITATHRQERTFLPPANYCPLCPTQPGAFETEIPAPAFDIVVFENRFPSLQAVPPLPAVEGSALYPVRPAQGVCEVVVYTDRHTTTLAEESVERIRRLILVWCDRFAELGAREEVAYVYIFENKGEAIGVTLHHPHGQIYAYPFIPPRVARQLAQSRQHWARTGRDLLGDILVAEQDDGRRIVCENEAFVVFVPFFARYPYETLVVPKRQVTAIVDFNAHERQLLAEILKALLVGYDRLFGFSLPYIMALHQRPTDGQDYPYVRFYIEFLPPHRTAAKLKYLAGSESGAGAFINDTIPEETAPRLRACCLER
ncbi:galactose-1-phosphate uridylyltransferase [Chloracidobacterium thermophilum]|jgi:UDPglucose--hexose-1-phosphate uridylyltransferase|uniref:Galactose-1-phosphate uridylyltransferase n=1 Tax=Chloracidobacterium thermophilum (strain B) TaxID=981222 RepID=G2LJU3_CHLTF|nr:galactose-1-phosphate uridylyltransferase [Chloracidobacterium thermophilum]AEP13110.1 galactose-1-phosphate uridylyltransferase, family 1 [Chloracidobacterium thermophilum B]QUV80376.1 galactose-1-phosphate uridylyltransferase [Chloracidobacterium thermophilum]